MQKDIKLNRANVYVIRFNPHGMGLFMSNDAWGLLVARRGGDNNIYSILSQNGSYTVDTSSNTFRENLFQIQTIDQKLDFDSAFKECGIPTIEEMKEMIEKAEGDFDLEKLNDFDRPLNDDEINAIRKSSVRIGLILTHIKNLLSYIELGNENNTEEKTGFDAMKKNIKTEAKPNRGTQKSKFDEIIAKYHTLSVSAGSGGPAEVVGNSSTDSFPRADDPVDMKSTEF